MAEKEKLLQWHAAFFAGIQIELEKEAEYLIFIKYMVMLAFISRTQKE